MSERTVRYAPKASATPMRKGSISDVIAQALLDKKGATIKEIRTILVAINGDSDKYSNNYVSGYLWDLSHRGYGLEVDDAARYYLVLPADTKNLEYQPDKATAATKEPKPEKAAKAAKAPAEPKTKKSGKGKGKVAAPVAEGGDEDIAQPEPVVDGESL